MSIGIAGRINPMVAICRRVAWLASVEGNKTRGGPGATPMSTARRLDIYEAFNGTPVLTPAQRRRMRQKHARKVGITPEVPPSWERPTTLLPLVVPAELESAVA